MREKIVLTVCLTAAIVLSGCRISHFEEPAVAGFSTAPDSFPCCVLEGHEDRVIHVEFAPRSNRLVSLSEDGVDVSTMIFWHGASGAMIDSFTNVNNADKDVEFSRQGETIGIGSRTLFLLDAESLRLIRTFEAESYEFYKVVDLEMVGFTWPFMTKTYKVERRYRNVTSVSFSPDVRYVASGLENGQVKVWEIKTGDLLNVLWATKVFGGIIDVEFSPDGRFIAACQDDERIRVWRFPDYREMILEGHKRAVYSIVFDPVNGHLVSAGVGGRVRIWDIETGKTLREIKAHDKAIMTITVTEDGKTLVTGSKDNTIGIWELATGRRIAELPGHGKQVNSVAVNSNATLLASGSDDGTVRIWDISNMGLCDNISLTPVPLYPANLDGQVWFEEASGDGALSSGEKGRFRINISNEGEGAAYNIVILAIPDKLSGSLEIVSPGVIPMLLPGRSVEKSVTVSNIGESDIENVVFTFRILESNGFHLNPPLKASIVRISPE